MHCVFIQLPKLRRASIHRTRALYASHDASIDRTVHTLRFEYTHAKCLTRLLLDGRAQLFYFFLYTRQDTTLRLLTLDLTLFLLTSP